MVLTDRPPPPELPDPSSGAPAVRDTEMAAAGHANGSGAVQRRASSRDKKVRRHMYDASGPKALGVHLLVEPVTLGVKARMCNVWPVYAICTLEQPDHLLGGSPMICVLRWCRSESAGASGMQRLTVITARMGSTRRNTISTATGTSTRVTSDLIEYLDAASHWTAQV